MKGEEVTSEVTLDVFCCSKKWKTICQTTTISILGTQRTFSAYKVVPDIIYWYNIQCDVQFVKITLAEINDKMITKYKLFQINFEVKLM